MSQHIHFDALLERLLAAWAAGDAEAYADCFTPDARYVAFDGDMFVGREAIAAAHRPLFARWLKGSRLVQESIEVTPLSSGSVVAHGRGAVLPKGRTKVSARRRSTQTYVAVESGGEWRFAAFQNTRYRPFARSLLGRLLSFLSKP